MIITNTLLLISVLISLYHTFRLQKRIEYIENAERKNSEIWKDIFRSIDKSYASTGAIMLGFMARLDKEEGSK